MSDLTALLRWVEAQRWFATPDPATPASTEATGEEAPSLVSIPLPTRPATVVGLLDGDDGSRYQLVLAPASPARRSARAGAPAPDLGSDPTVLAALAGFVAGGGFAGSPEGCAVQGHWAEGALPLGDAPARALGLEQSNTSAVVGGTHVLKLFRRLQAGPHPEVEIGEHLAAVAPPGELPIARLSGWWELVEADRASTALGVVQELVPGALDGWELVLGGLAGDPDGLLARLHALGRAVARLHSALARPSIDAPADPERPEAFGATPLGRDRLDAVVDAVAADAARVLGTGIDRPPQLGPVVGRGEQVAVLARDLAASLGSDLGPAIRHHGDLHLGQTVVGPDGWVILDFEGEPARPLDERRQRHSPLRDVAGMLRSLAYAVATHDRTGGPRLSPGWEPAARAALLDGYLVTVDPALVPTSAVATARLLALFELEKVVYEIGYELAHRPDWVGLPVRGLRQLLGEGS